jgi:hypothetical protein
MNPEFRRQLWLQFSASRLIVLPLLLATTFITVYLSVPIEPAEPLAAVAMLLFGVLVLGMGTFAAGGSVMDEIADRTWDQQRMSAMQPWAMTWGKLAGSSAYSWYGGALCLLVALPSAMLLEPLSFVLKATAMAVLAGVFLQALLIAINLQLLKSGSRVSRRGGVWALLLVLLWGSGMVMATLRGANIGWWSLNMGRLDFALASLALFTVCALVAAWRSMAEVLAVRQLPWGWPAMALAATVYISGFAWAQRLPVLGVVGLSVCAVLTYFALLTEPQTRPHWQRVVNRASAAQWQALLLQLPRWPTTLVLAFPFAMVSAMSLGPLASVPWALSSAVLLQPVAFVLLLGRDCALALFFAFSPQTRRPVMAFAVLMLVLYALLPWLLRTLGGPALASLALPLLGNGVVAMVIAAGHLGVAIWLLRWRWQTTVPRSNGA